MERALLSTAVTDVMKGKKLLQRDVVCNGNRTGGFHHTVRQAWQPGKARSPALEKMTELVAAPSRKLSRELRSAGKSLSASPPHRAWHTHKHTGQGLACVYSCPDSSVSPVTLQINRDRM